MSGRVIPGIIVGCLFLSWLCPAACHAELSRGDIAPDFTLKEFGTNTPVHLYDFAGQIVVLDFFAYWCGPCAVAADYLEPNLQQYYAARGGNPSHIPVQLISLTIDGDYGSTMDYINQHHLELVLDDSSYTVYGRFGDGYIPAFAVINGVDGATMGSGGPTLRQWEILRGNPKDQSNPPFNDRNYSSFRATIDQVVTVPEPATLWSLAAGALTVLLVIRVRRLGKRR